VLQELANQNDRTGRMEEGTNKRPARVARSDMTRNMNFSIQGTSKNTAGQTRANQIRFYSGKI
jgi:hypothetical protein